MQLVQVRTGFVGVADSICGTAESLLALFLEVFIGRQGEQLPSPSAVVIPIRAPLRIHHMHEDKDHVLHIIMMHNL